MPRKQQLTQGIVMMIQIQVLQSTDANSDHDWEEDADDDEQMVEKVEK